MPRTAVFKALALAHKAASPAPNPDNFRMVVSSSDIDSYGDVVLLSKIDWRYLNSNGSLPLLFGHDSRLVVGLAKDFEVVGGKLMATAQLAKAGTSADVDMVRALFEQGMLDGVSFGFMVESATPINPKDPFGGQYLEGLTPIEITLTPTPANPAARVAFAKEFVPLFAAAQSAASIYQRSAYSQLHSPPRVSGTPPSTPPPTTRSTNTMTTADKIKAKQQEILSLRDQITAVTNDIDGTGALTDPQTEALAELSAKLDRATGHLRTLEATEAVIARSLGDLPEPQGGTNPVPRIQVRTNRPKGHAAFAAIAAIVKGFGLRQDPAQIAEATHRDDPEIAHLVRAATAPATTTHSTWAANLVEQAWGDFIELLRDTSIYMQVPGRRMDISLTTNLPVNNGRGTLSGGFIGENGAIPVKSGNIGTTSLSPKKLAVISSYTKELARRSMPSIESIVRDQILVDTTETLDTLFLDNQARTAIRPAGLQDPTETGAGNINAVTNVATGAHGSTVEEILLDVDALLGRAEAIKATGGVWLMNPAQVRGLRNKQDATTGEFVFRDSIDSGRFEGIPIVQSTNVTGGIVSYVSSDAMGFGQELSPYFEMSDSATLHFEDTSPAAIGTVATPNVVAAPTYSLFQQDAFALKMVWTLDWRILRKAGVQVLTGATGW